MPECFNRQQGEPIAEADPVGARVQHVAVDEVATLAVKAVPQPSEPPDGVRSGRHGGLGLDGHDAPVGGLKDEIDLGTAVVSEVAELRSGVVPCELFGHLAGHECLDESADGSVGGAGQRRRVLVQEYLLC